MNEQLQSSLVELVEYIKQGGDLVGQHAPAVAEEYLRWCFAEACIWLAASSAVFTFTACLLFRWAHRADGDELVMGFGIVVALVSLVFGCCSLSQIVKIHTAPRVVLLEKVSKLMMPAARQ